MYQIISNRFTCKDINILTSLDSYNVTDSESYLSLIIAYVVHDLRFVEDESFNLLVRHACT